MDPWDFEGAIRCALEDSAPPARRVSKTPRLEFPMTLGLKRNQFWQSRLFDVLHGCSCIERGMA
jgi:hypothetical protein